jgi:hypothetical protein
MKDLPKLKGYRVVINNGMFNASSTVHSMLDTQQREKVLLNNWVELKNLLFTLTNNLDKNCICKKENNEHDEDCNTTLIRRKIIEFESSIGID